MHLVLGGLHRDTGDNTCSLDALSRARFAMTSHIALLEHLVQWVLHTGQTLGGIVVLVMDVQIVTAHSLTCLLAQEIVIHEGLGRLASELHHHAGRGIGIHVGVLACDIIIFGIDNLQEQVTCLGLAGYAAFLAIVDIAAGHLLAGTFHQLKLHLVLDVLNAHLGAAALTYAISDALDECLVLAGSSGKHSLADRGLDFLFVIADDTAITLQYCLNHIVL